MYSSDSIVLSLVIQHYFSFSSRLPYSQYEIIPLGKWEILPEQIEFQEELGRGAFGVVYKATFRKRVGMEIFDTDISKRPLLPTNKAPQVVAVKVLRGKNWSWRRQSKPWSLKFCNCLSVLCT